ncbi:VHS-domain-containing protein [Clavulina sp. PMI_390]|nr:VHS-domain-containing protein [Clavulina sp. PMI_390]
MMNWNASPVEIYVHRCCDPSLREPNYALNIELAEFINTKKANTPREAAMTLARLVNHRNPHVSVLALTVIGTLVQNCGYPFHLQISTKEFLNELVRRFPERPPPFPGPIMSRILDLIHTWKETLCKDSRFKEDFGNIRDMHRLLSFKGYRFRDASRNQNAAVAAQDVSVNLKSPEELEAEDREAQSAKLQELIRRGTPRDLQAAQELMKTLSGANPDAKPDYRSKTLHELEKLQSHVILLNDMLDNFDTSKPERLVSGDAYDQVAIICRNSRPKIQKWISDAQEDDDDPEALENFLSINDLINNVLDRYERYQKGDFSAAPQPQATVANDLIDFDAGQSATSGPTSAANELEELFGGSSSSQPPRQAISLGSTAVVPQASGAASFFSYGNNPTPPLVPAQSAPVSQPQSFWNSNASTSRPGSALNGFQTQQAPSPVPSFGGVANMNAFGASGSGRSTPLMPTTQPSTTKTTNPAPAPAAAAKDPFADLEGLF